MFLLEVLLVLWALGTGPAQEAKRCGLGCENRGVQVEEATVDISEDRVPCGAWNFEIGGIPIGSDEGCPDRIVFSPDCGLLVERLGYCIALHRFAPILAYSPECYRLWNPIIGLRLSICILGRPDMIGFADCFEEAVCFESYEGR
ncbi:MAG: hypothetical protein RL885_14235 [Planctomycetota bacterium]